MYQIAENQNGPWLDFIQADTAQKALDHARAVLDWNPVWVAKMRPLQADDLLPSDEMLGADMKERLAEHYGSYTVGQFEDSFELESLVAAAKSGIGIILEQNPLVYVPDIKRLYRKGQNVRPADFAGPQKPRLEDLM